MLCVGGAVYFCSVRIGALRHRQQANALLFSKYPKFIRLRLKITFYIFLHIMNNLSVTTLAWHRSALRWRQGIDLDTHNYL